MHPCIITDILFHIKLARNEAVVHSIYIKNKYIYFKKKSHIRRSYLKEWMSACPILVLENLVRLKELVRLTIFHRNEITFEHPFTPFTNETLLSKTFKFNFLHNIMTFNIARLKLIQVLIYTLLIACYSYTKLLITKILFEIITIFRYRLFESQVLHLLNIILW